MSPDVDNAVFYHINRHDRARSSSERLEVGKMIIVGDAYNAFYGHYVHTGWLSAAAPFRDGTSARLRGAAYLTALLNDEIAWASAAGRLNDFVEVSREVVRQQYQQIREMVFEDVRRERYPHLPSRQTCMWLCPTKESVRYWSDQLDLNEETRYFEVRASGKIHTGSDEWMYTDTRPINQVREWADYYWQGVPASSDGSEVVFEGEVEIVAEHPPEYFGIHGG